MNGTANQASNLFTSYTVAYMMTAKWLGRNWTEFGRVVWLDQIKHFGVGWCPPTSDACMNFPVPQKLAFLSEYSSPCRNGFVPQT